MRKIHSFLSISMIFLFTCLSSASAMPAPSNLISFNSAKGQLLLQRSQHKQGFYALMPYFVSEKGLSFCAPASAVMVLNALAINRPLALQHAPYHFFTQDNFFTSSVLNITTPATINYEGMTLSQLAAALKTFSLTITLVNAQQVTEQQFRQAAIAAVSTSKQFVIVNFYRKKIHEKGSGHFSPLAAYDQKTDRFLLLDVARYKYLPVWVRTDDLYQAMKTNAGSKGGRGYLLISK